MDLYEDSDQSSNYNSDQIDSETEVMLYGAIHHAIASEDQQLVPEVPDIILDLNKTQSTSKQIENEKSSQSKAIESQTKITTNDKPLNNLFRLLDSKLDESDEDFCFDFDFSKDIPQNENKRKIDVIDIDDSSDSDSDICIIEDNVFATKSKTRATDKQKSPKNQQKLVPIQSTSKELKEPNLKPKIDISLGNVDNLIRSSLEVMNEFYDEDNYDSEEEANNFSRMSADRSLWKISRNDILLTHSKNNRYYRNRFICNNCNERGHQARDCPLPKVCTKMIYS